MASQPEQGLADVNRQHANVNTSQYHTDAPTADEAARIASDLGSAIRAVLADNEEGG